MRPTGGDLDGSPHHNPELVVDRLAVLRSPAARFREAVSKGRLPGPARLAGVAAIVVFVAVAFAWFLAITGAAPDREIVVLPDLAMAADDSTSPSPVGPTYLAFRATVDSRVYTVDRSTSAGASVPSPKADVETDIFPAYSLANRSSIAPGLYATRFGIEECSFELRRFDTGGVEKVIGQDRVVGGRVLVTVHDVEPDVFDPALSCGQWSEWSPLVDQLEAATSGDYWRSDLRAGIWNVSRGCEWEKVVGFRGADLADVYDSGIGPGVMEIDEDMLGVRIRRCPNGMTWDQPLPPSDAD